MKIVSIKKYRAVFRYFLMLFFLLAHGDSQSQSVFDKIETWLVDHHLHASYGVQKAWFKNSNLKFVQSEYGRELEFANVKSKDKLRLNSLKEGQVGCSQFRVNIGVELSPNYSIYILATHLTYLIETEETYYRNGRWDNLRVSDEILFSDYFDKLEHSNGINTWNLGIRRNFKLKHGGRHKLSLGITPQLGGVFTASQAAVKNPNGVNEYYDPGNSLAGYNYALDFALEFLYRRMIVEINYNYFQMNVKKAKLAHDSYVDQIIRGYNYGLSIGYRF